MPKEKTTLPAWKNEPLKFAFSPDAALRRGAFVKSPKNWGKAIRAKRLARN
jgi:hypothetical protein